MNRGIGSQKEISTIGRDDIYQSLENETTIHSTSLRNWEGGEATLHTSPPGDETTISRQTLVLVLEYDD